MSENKTQNDSIDTLVRGLVASMSENGDSVVPMSTTDTAKVVDCMLTENTGRHLLDSGSAYGRNFEENQENPPSEKATWQIEDGYVLHNVRDFLTRKCDRPNSAVALESALYAYADLPSMSGESWLSVSQSFADEIVQNNIGVHELREDLNLPEQFVSDVLQVQDEVQKGIDNGINRDPINEAQSFNTYNMETHSLTQDIEVRMLGGPYAEYVIVHVHGGCDIRGGYTAPRVFHNPYETVMPHELQYDCTRLEWYNAESCLFRSDELLYVPDVTDIEQTVSDRLQKEGIEIEQLENHPAIESAYEYNNENDMNGAVFVFPEHENDFGIVTFA